MALLMRGTEYGDEQLRASMERELRARLEEDRPLRVYCGYDPTSVDLHLGHTLSMRKLAQFQSFGHEVTFLVGNFTGLVGDPSGRNKERPMLTAEELSANAQTYADQAFRILDGETARVRYNADWLSQLTFADVTRLLASFTVAQFLERDNFAKRFEQHDAIHLSEFMYAIMQAYDAVAMDTDVQVGGTEQLFNLMAGRTLQRDADQQPQIVVTVPILVGTDGHQRMSKSQGNYIGIDDAPSEMYGKVMSLPDTAIVDYFTLVTAVPGDEVESIEEALGGGALAPMEAKKRLAREVTASLYSDADALEAQEHFEQTIQRGEMPEEMAEHAIEGSETLLNALRDAGVVASGGEARRLVTQGGVMVNGDVVAEITHEVSAGDEIKVGRHRFLRIVEAG
jgi:tyrosyl-tRNA synthetase